MSRRFSTATILILVLALRSMSQTVEDRVLHDARAIHDTALLRSSDYEVNEVPSWVVAKIDSGARSGSATVPGAYIKAETGVLVSRDNVALALIKEGRWKKIAAARGDVAESAEYSWLEPSGRKRALTPEDFYSPFTRGGTIIFRPTPGAAGIEQFGTVRLIFSDWHDYVEPAFTFMRSEPVFQRNGHVSRSELPRLTQLLSQDNELIAASTFRELVRSGQVTPTLVRNQLTRAEVNLNAIYTYVVLTSPNQQLVKEVIGVTKTTHDRTKLRAIALGAFAASLFRTEDTEITTRSKSVLGVARQRLKDLNIAVEGDPYLAFIFEKMSV